MRTLQFEKYLRLRSDIHLSSLFALHRPISITSTFPPQSSTSSFNSIFEPPPFSHKADDVIYTISSFVSAFEGSNSNTQGKSSRRTANNIHHLDGFPSLDQLSKQFQPFHIPPPPVPMDSLNHDETAGPKGLHHSQQELQQREADEAANAQHPFQPSPEAASRNKRSAPKKKRRTFTASFTTDKAMNAETVKKTHTIKAGPVVETQNRLPRRDDSMAAGAEVKTLSKSKTKRRRPIQSQMKSRPALWSTERLKQRPSIHSQSETITDSNSEFPANNSGLESHPTSQIVEPSLRDRQTMLLISVKRRRKLKMKKHKYKKLMRRTRNLRRREGRM